jgi:hypothetical protein
MATCAIGGYTNPHPAPLPERGGESEKQGEERKKHGGGVKSTEIRVEHLTPLSLGERVARNSIKVDGEGSSDG